MKTKDALVSAARGGTWTVKENVLSGFSIFRDGGWIGASDDAGEAHEIVQALRLAAALPSVRAALELAEATYSNLSSAEFAVGDDKPAREALRSALAALDAAGAA